MRRRCHDNNWRRGWWWRRQDDDRWWCRRNCGLFHIHHIGDDDRIRVYGFRVKVPDAARQPPETTETFKTVLSPTARQPTGSFIILKVSKVAMREKLPVSVPMLRHDM